jgi:hypothetical protein
MFDFGTALNLLKAGARLTRKDWNGDIYIFYQCGFPHSCTNSRFQPYLMLKTANNTLVPWVASQIDLLAEDWFILAPLEP